MATTTVLIVADPAVVTPVTVTIVTTALGIFDGAGAVLARSQSYNTLSDGTLSLPIERTGDITTDGSTVPANTTTITVGANVFSGLTIPASGSPVTLASLIPSRVDHTVAITNVYVDPSEGGIGGVGTPVFLSIDCFDVDGRLVSSSTPVNATTDSGGNETWHLYRTDQLTPANGLGGEPYYRFVVRQSTFYRKIHGAGTLGGLIAALPTQSNGSISATQTGLNSTLTPLVDDADQAAATLADDIAVLKARYPGAFRTITTSAAISATTDDVLLINAVGGNIAPTLPAATLRVREYRLLRIDAAGTTVTLTPHAGDTIQGAATLVIGGGVSYVLISNGATDWRILSSSAAPLPSVAAHTFLGGGTSGGSITAAARLLVASDLPATLSWQTFSADHPYAAGDTGLLMDGTAAIRTVTLPSAVGFVGLPITVKKKDGSAHAINVATVSSQTIEGAASPYAVHLQGDWVTLASDGANWYVLRGGSGGGGSSSFSWTTYTADHTVTTADSGILVDATGGNVTITLLDAASVIQSFAVKRKDNSVNTVTVATTGGQTIDGFASWPLTTQDQGIIVGSDTANWAIQGGFYPSPFTTKGDLVAANAAGAAVRVAVGTDGYGLVADSTQAAGVKWTAVASPHIYEPVVLSVTAGVPDFLVIGGDIVMV